MGDDGYVAMLAQKMFSIHNKIIFVMKKETKAAGVMTSPGNVTHETGEQPEQKKEPVNTVVKRIIERAKSADSFEYDDQDYAQEIYDKLPEGMFTIKTGDKTVIQKL